MKIIKHFINLFIVVLYLGGVTLSAKENLLDLAAKVNGVAISNVLLERNFEEYLRDNNIKIGAIRNPKRLKKFKREVLDLLIQAELLWQAANKNKVVADKTEIESAISRVKGQFRNQNDFIKKIKLEGYTQDSYQQHVTRMVTARKYLDHIRQTTTQVSNAEIHKFYINNPDKFKIPDMVHAQHILLKLNASDKPGKEQELQQTINKIHDEIVAGVDFSSLAKKYSQDASASNGGDLGFFTRGRMVIPFEKVVFEMKPGEISEVVKTRFGLHIIKMLEKRPANQATEAQAYEQIRAYLRNEKIQLVEKTEIQRLRTQSKIEVLIAL